MYQLANCPNKRRALAILPSISPIFQLIVCALYLSLFGCGVAQLSADEKLFRDIFNAAAKGSRGQVLSADVTQMYLSQENGALKGVIALVERNGFKFGFDKFNSARFGKAQRLCDTSAVMSLPDARYFPYVFLTRRYVAFCFESDRVVAVEAYLSLGSF